MRITPDQAYAASPLCKLTDEENGVVASFCDMLDQFLKDKWTGFVQKLITPEFNARQMGCVMRLYGQAGWTVFGTPMNGKLQDAQTLLDAGQAVGWSVTIAPRWETVREARDATVTPLKPVPPENLQ